MKQGNLQIKRIYEEAEAHDGFRVLVDRLWPRGVSKERAHLDMWLKEIAPSVELRTWFGHKSENFSEFRIRYEAELRKNPAVSELKKIIQEHTTTTLLYGARNEQINHAVVLQEYLLNHI